MRIHPWARVLLAAILAMLVAIGVGAVRGARAGDDRAPSSVSVAGVNVSHLTRDEVSRAVRYRARQLMAEPIVITRSDDPDFRLQVSRTSLGARAQVTRAVAEATEPRALGGRVLGGLGIVPERSVTLGFTLNRAKVQRLVSSISSQLDDPAPKPTRLVLKGSDIEIRDGTAGYGVDATWLRDRILAVPTEPIEITPGPLQPPVSRAAAEEARATALKVIAEPVDITFQGNAVTIPESVLRSALRFVSDPPRIRVALDQPTLYTQIAPAFELREQPARDASFRVTGQSVRLVSSRKGRRLDMAAIAESIVADPDTRSVRARFEVSEPALTTEEAQKLGITELVSSFSTPYPCCEPRVTNIKRAAEILNGMIIPAGGTFSLNDALGRRTADRGFVEAPQIAAGRLEDAVGGGVSQMATTLYNAAFFAGLDLVSHTPHQFYISRYPPGREATVSFGGPELIFRNDWKAAVLLNVWATDNGVTVQLFSSKLGRRVETTTGERTDIEEPETKETVDPALEPGDREVEQEMGGPGFTISYTRKVWAGSRLKRDETFTWKYSPQDAFIKVGPPQPRNPDRNGAPEDDRDTPRTTTRPDTTTAPPSTRSTPQTNTGGAAPPPPG
ncbi:MAG: VanW family protein [Thermoleophilia bacterium]